jgi:hypothetical protein
MALRDLDPPPSVQIFRPRSDHVWLFSETYGDDRHVVRRPWRRFVFTGMPEEERLVVAERYQIAASAEGMAKPVL